MTATPGSERVLILGGAGMVGIEVAREAARYLSPSSIIISGLTQREVDESLETLRADAAEHSWKTKFEGVAGDIFIPKKLQGSRRSELTGNRELFDVLFADIFAPEAGSFRESALYALLDEYRPNVVVDCINTATAISYQDSYTLSRRVKHMLDGIEDSGGIASELLPDFLSSVRELIIAQGVPQITRHILLLHQALRDSSVRVYVKVGTTGTGGMGVNIPYTHSEDKPSTTLLSKSAIGFAHTGLLFLLARTPGRGSTENPTHGTMIKEVKPGAMIGFKRLGVTHVRLSGPDGSRQPGYLLENRQITLDSSVTPRDSYESYPRFEGRDIPVEMVGADTGENGFFSIGEFQAITYPRQMEYVTPEEVARTTVLEILGTSTGRDVISAIDGAITEPSYRAGILRDRARREMERLEQLLAGGDVLPSIAVGHLGPPRLSKLLIEAWLIRAAAGTASIEAIRAIEPDVLLGRIEAYLQANPRVSSLITTIGIPILRESNGERVLQRGPRLNIPVPRPDGQPVPLDDDSIERYARMGWVDLRATNVARWGETLDGIVGSQPDIAGSGSSSFRLSSYLPAEFSPGDVVGWLLANETDEQGMVGHRVL